MTAVWDWDLVKLTRTHHYSQVKRFFVCLFLLFFVFFFFSAGSGHMVRNKLCWDANDAARLSKQRSSYQSSPTFLCFGSPTTLFASQHNLFRTMRPDHTKGLLLILLVSTKIKPNTLSGRATVGLHLSRKLWLLNKTEYGHFFLYCNTSQC